MLRVEAVPAAEPAQEQEAPSQPVKAQYVTPEITDLGAWQIITGSVLVPCDPFSCDVTF